MRMRSRNWGYATCNCQSKLSVPACLVKVQVARSCPAPCDPMDDKVHGISPGQNTGVGSCFLLQGIFPIQGSNPGLPHCRWILYPLSHKGARLDDHIKSLSWKRTLTWTFLHQCLSWLGPPLPWGVLIRPQILLRVLKKNWGPTREGPLQFSLYLLIKIGSFVSFWEVLYMNNIVWYLPVSVWLTSLSMIISRCIHVVANDISFFLMIE